MAAGLRMLSPEEIKHIYSVSRVELVPAAVTFTTILSRDLISAVGLGMMSSFCLNFLKKEGRLPFTYNVSHLVGNTTTAEGSHPLVPSPSLNDSPSAKVLLPPLPLLLWVSDDFMHVYTETHNTGIDGRMHQLSCESEDPENVSGDYDSVPCTDTRCR